MRSNHVTRRTRAGRFGALTMLAAATAVVFATRVGVGQQPPPPSASWRDYGGGPDSAHYSPARQITKENVARLQLAWEYPTGDNAGYLFNPIAVDNMVYVLARNSSLVALDATTGKEIWVHEGLQGIAGRGINYWESADRSDRRLVFQIRSQLQAIDARTGLSILTFGENGYVDLRQGLGRDPLSITRIQSGTPGRIFENLIILGSATGEGYLSPPGDLRAYDVRTGKLVWQFHTIPRPGEFGYDTWPKDAYKYIGGANTWGEISVDEKRGIAYFPVGSATYDFYGADRKGANLFTDCILALDARTGKYLWHFQQVHHDLWDYDPVSAPQLVTIRHNGQDRDVVAQAGKTSFLYVLDRVTGQPIWPIEERRVAASTMPEEEAWPTQPFPTVVPPFGRQLFTAEDVNPNLPPEQREALRERIAKAENKGLFTPPAMRDTVQMPGNRGGSNWGTTAANPAKGLVYVLSIDAPALLKMAPVQLSSVIGGSNAFLNIAGPNLYTQYCASCHGADLAGTQEVPALTGITTRMGSDVLGALIRQGRNRMPPIPNLTDAEIARLIEYLANPTGAGRGGVNVFGDGRGGGRGGGRGAAGAGGAGGRGAGPGNAPAEVPAAPVGPVVASGGAPAGRNMPVAPPRGAGAPPADAYPEGVEVPAARYFTGWNVLYDAISGPWNTLTAYDLNNGSIRWQIPLGEMLTEQRGVVTTATGLVFLATGDGKVRAYDEENGKLLWTGDLPMGARSIPAMYEAGGRQYILVSATQPIATGAPGATPPAASRRAYVAFALPPQ